jgi:hypothetical protein
MTPDCKRIIQAKKHWKVAFKKNSYIDSQMLIL